MLSKKFKIRYYIESVETRSSPLFSIMRAYLLTEGNKRFIGQASSNKQKKIMFEATIQQDGRQLRFNEQGVFFISNFISILLEFGSQGKFLRMGQTKIDIAEVVNNGRSGEVIPYRFQKCYDRNAKVFISISFSEYRRQEVSHSRSQCLLPQPRLKIRTSYERMNLYTTEGSQLTDRQDKQDQLSAVSDRFNQKNSKTLNRTEIYRKNTPQNQEFIDLKTQNRIYAHQLAQSEYNCREIEEESESLRELLKACKANQQILQAQITQLRNEVAERDLGKENLRQQLNTQIARLLKIYQQSQQQRNKLLVDHERQVAAQAQRRRQIERKSTEEHNKLKTLERSEQNLRRKAEQYLSQLGVYQKAMKTEFNAKQKLIESLQNEMQLKHKLQLEITFLKQQKDKLAFNNQQLQSELEISRFSMEELQKDVAQIKSKNAQLLSLVRQYQQQLKQSSDILKIQRSDFNRKMQQVGQQSQMEQKAIEGYLEQLEIKTLNEYNKNTQISILKKEVVKLKRQIKACMQQNAQFDMQIQQLHQAKQFAEEKVSEQQATLLQLTREKAVLQSQLKSAEQKQYDQRRMNNSQWKQEQRQELINRCYIERDELWKKQIQKLEGEIHTLMQKSKRQKDDLIESNKKLRSQLRQNEQLIRRLKYKLNQKQEVNEELKKMIKKQQVRYSELQKINKDERIQRNRLQLLVKQLQKKIQLYIQNEQQIIEGEKKLLDCKKQINKLKLQLQLQKNKLKLYKSDIKIILNQIITYLSTSDKQKIFYDQLQLQNIQTEILIPYNSAAKIYCDRHNKIKSQIQQLEEIRNKLERKERQNHQSSKMLRGNRKSSVDSVTSFNNSQSSMSATRILEAINGPSQRHVEREDSQLKELKKQNEQLRNRLKKEEQQRREVQKQIWRQKQQLESNIQESQSLKEDLENKEQQLTELQQKMKLKERQFDTLRDDLKESSAQVLALRTDLQQMSKALKIEKGNALKRSTVINRSVNFGRNEDINSTKIFQLQKRLKIAQDELEKFKKQKEQRKGQLLNNRQLKILQSRLKEKDEVINGLKETLQQQRQKGEQQKELHLLKIRKLKEDFQQQLENKSKIEKEQNDKISDTQEKVRQLQKRIKILEENLKNTNSQLLTFNDREEKNRRVLITEWQLKLKNLQGDHEAQIASILKKVEDFKAMQRTARQGERKKQREAAELKIQLERSQRSVVDLSEKLELYGLRLKSMEEDETNYKQVIGVLESKFRQESIEDQEIQGNLQRQMLDNRSNYSHKTFTFR